MDTLCTILRKYTDMPVTKSARLMDDLELDSFLIVYFLSEVEDAFEIDLDMSDISSIVTVEDVLDLINRT